MRILTWNINGVRTLPQYHPWNTMATFTNILDALEADVICFQEVKSSRTSLSKGVAVPPSYHAFFSFPVRRTGYSGVSTYVRTTSVVPLKAEEGLCSIIQPKPPLTNEERVSTVEGYPQRILEGNDSDIDYKDLDSEGRTLVLDFGLFVLINVYCPNDGNGTDERNKYKADFHAVLEARVKGLVEVEGREVMVVGDLNACAAVIDHCEGPLMVAKGLAEGLVGEEGFWGKDSRRWMRDFMVSEDGTSGHMIDTTRRLWPDRQGMYTCWNTKISARDSNYGTRIDYIMITSGLLPWVKGADIQPHIKGSDHCPVYVDLHDEIVDSTGATIQLQDVMAFKKDQPQEPPRISSKFWDEYSGKQRLLQQFFGKSTAITPIVGFKGKFTEEIGSVSVVPESMPATHAGAELPETLSFYPGPSSSEISKSPTSSMPLSTLRSLSPQSSQSSTAVKRRLTIDTLSRNSSRKKQKRTQPSEKPGQVTIASYFAKPRGPSTSAMAPPSQQVSKSAETENIEAYGTGFVVDDVEVDIEIDYRLALLSQAEAETPLSSLPNADSSSTSVKQAWSSIMAPVQPPKCIVHGEPAKELTVTKPGPNKGKKFFICSRPVGPGYDKGRAERRREDVDPKWRCDFFKWSNDARRQMKPL
ncbi:hypothetical protein H2248_010331 [Termitomyces sp. 'cryptogamus']|nr:hypothetical protein H2248_010331 [Termitomyces sp. 'cryptogamus']